MYNFHNKKIPFQTQQTGNTKTDKMLNFQNVIIILC